MVPEFSEQDLIRKDLLLDDSIERTPNPIIFKVKSKTRDFFHYVNLEKNECSCESKLYRGLYKKAPDYQCEHIKRVLEMLKK